MAEEPNVAPVAAPVVDPNANADLSKTLFAGKHSPDGLEKATIEIRGKLGLPSYPEGKKLVGDNGVFPDHVSLETEYKGYESMMGKITPAKPAEPVAKTGDGLSIENAADPVPDGGTEALLKAAGMEGQEKVLADQFIKEGKLTEEQYDKFAKSSLPRSRQEVDEKMRGKIAEAEVLKGHMKSANAKAEQLAGGDTQLNNLLAFARTLPKDQQVELQGRLDVPSKVEGVIRELLSVHAEAVGAGNAEALHSGGFVPNNAASHKITSHKELAEATAKAQQGDLESIEKFRNMSLKEMQHLTM